MRDSDATDEESGLATLLLSVLSDVRGVATHPKFDDPNCGRQSRLWSAWRLSARFQAQGRDQI